MYVPVNADRVTSGINLTERYAKEKNVEVGIIPCADGGSSLEQWCVGVRYYDEFLKLSSAFKRVLM